MKKIYVIILIMVSGVFSQILTAGNTQIYKINPSAAYTEAKSRGFNFGVKWKSKLSTCEIKGNGAYLSLKATAGAVIGSKCDFRIFYGKNLAPGWKIVSFRSYGKDVKGKQGYSYLKSPGRGSSNMEFIIRVWSAASIRGSKGKRLGVFGLQEIELEGPKDSDWKNAFK